MHSYDQEIERLKRHVYGDIRSSSIWKDCQDHILCSRHIMNSQIPFRRMHQKEVLEKLKSTKSKNNIFKTQADINNTVASIKTRKRKISTKGLKTSNSRKNIMISGTIHPNTKRAVGNSFSIGMYH